MAEVVAHLLEAVAGLDEVAGTGVPQPVRAPPAARRLACGVAASDDVVERRRAQGPVRGAQRQEDDPAAGPGPALHQVGGDGLAHRRVQRSDFPLSALGPFEGDAVADPVNVLEAQAAQLDRPQAVDR